MKTLFNIKNSLIVALVGLLAGCSANPVNNAFTNMWDMGGGLPSAMTSNIIYSAVVADEAHVTSLGRQDRAISYNQGVRYDSPEEHYRLVRVDMANHSASFMRWPTTVAIPDSFPLLKTGDVLAIRLTKTRDGLMGFAESKEGSAAVAVMCLEGAAGYEQCWKNLPLRNPTDRMRGANGVALIPYGPSLASFGLTFTPRYDDAGKVLPGAPVPPSRTAAVVQATAR